MRKTRESTQAKKDTTQRISIITGIPVSESAKKKKKNRPFNSFPHPYPPHVSFVRHPLKLHQKQISILSPIT